MRKLLVLIEFVLLATVAVGVLGIGQEILLRDKLCGWGKLRISSWWIQGHLIWQHLWPVGLLFGVMSGWPAVFYRHARSMQQHLLRSLWLALAITGLFWLLSFYAEKIGTFLWWKTLLHTLPLFLLMVGGLYGGVAWYKNWHHLRQCMQQQTRSRLALAAGLYALLVWAALWWWQQFFYSKLRLCFLLHDHVVMSRGVLLSIPLLWVWHGWHIRRDRRSPAQ